VSLRFDRIYGSCNRTSPVPRYIDIAVTQAQCSATTAVGAQFEMLWGFSLSLLRLVPNLDIDYTVV